MAWTKKMMGDYVTALLESERMWHEYLLRRFIYEVGRENDRKSD
jgi:hypothetical protein